MARYVILHQSLIVPICTFQDKNGNHRIQKLVGAAVSIPRNFGYNPSDAELYEAEEEETNKKRMFYSMDLKSTGVITLEPGTILDSGNLQEFSAFVKKAVVTEAAEHNELHWYLLEIFTEHDIDKDGTVTIQLLPAMVDDLVKLPVKLEAEYKETEIF